MEFRCPHCDHIGPAADVQTGADGVEVICESCSQSSSLEADEGSQDDSQKASNEHLESSHASQPDELEEIGDPEHPYAPPDPDSTVTQGAELASLSEQTLDELIPDPDIDRRCPKCVSPLSRSDLEHCPECGLHLEEARHYEEGEAPWEQPDRGREGALDRARDLWDRARRESTDEAFARFVDHVREAGLLRWSIRKLRLHLADHPDDEGAIEALRELASGMEARIVAAQAEAESEAESLQREISRFKRIMAGAIIVLWGIAMVVIVDLFLGWDLL